MKTTHNNKNQNSGASKKERIKGFLLENFTINVPHKIWFHEEISIKAKVLWGLIHSLHTEDQGGCIKSDAYLASNLSVSRSQLHKILAQLRKSGLVVNIGYPGMKAIRYAILPKKFTHVPKWIIKTMES